MNHLIRPASTALVWGLCALCSVTTGCRPAQSNARLATTAAESSDGKDNFDDFLNVWSSFNDYDPKTASRTMLLALTRWVELQEVDPQWKPSPLIERLPDSLADLELEPNLQKLEFTQRDVDFLRETLWMRQIAGWVTDPTRVRSFQHVIHKAEEGLDEEGRDEFQRQEDQLAAALLHLDDSLSEDEAFQLAACWRLFDWTVRNIQQDPLPEQSDDIAGPRPGATADPESLFKAGPGFAHFPWQVLLYGRGDAVERARVFIHLARQIDIPVIMLGYDDAGRISRATEWLPAAQIGERLFLFDSWLGVPIPGAETPIATLAEVRENPTLLSDLDWTVPGEEMLYPVTKTELDQLVGMLDVAPQFLSVRMHLIQQRLTGQYKAVITLDPDPLAALLADRYEIAVGLWNVPFKTIRFRRFLEQQARSNPRLAEFLFETERIFDGFHPLIRGRLKFFEGEFQRIEEQQIKGAKSYFLDARNIRDEYLDKLSTDESLQAAFGLVRGADEGGKDFEARVERFRIAFLLTKVHAGYWLALAHYEDGNYGDAANWLERAQQMDTTAIWSQGMAYNQARTHEALGQNSEAREIYYVDQSPQRLGNLVRARLLAEAAGEDEP